MRETSLRWALGMGAAAATLGVIAQIVAARLAPTEHAVTFDVAIKFLLVAGPIVLITVGLALASAYYAGLRAERGRPPAPAPDPDALPSWGGERRDSAMAGAIVMAIYWVITGGYGFVLNVHPGGQTVSGFLSQHLIQGVVFIILGYALGALGGRAPAARRLFDAISVPAAEATSRGPMPSAPPDSAQEHAQQQQEEDAGAEEGPRAHE